MKRFRHSILLIVLLIMLLPIQPVHADIAPPASPQIGGLEPFEYQNTEVEMVYERVEIEVLPPSVHQQEHIGKTINVTAYFSMRNTGEKAEQMQVMFPITDLACGLLRQGDSFAYYTIVDDSFDIRVDGEQIPLKDIISTQIKNAKVFGGTCEVDWATFEVAFPTNRDVVIRLSYTMTSLTGDSVENFDYVLETGAGWKGPIGRGYVVVKFPYEVGPENVLEWTTPGYQTLYNEIFWSFQSLEPTSKDNIHVSMLGAYTWQSILAQKEYLKENPKDVDAWVQLAETYHTIPCWHGCATVRSNYYLTKIPATFEQGIALNPQNANLYGAYAEYSLMGLNIMDPAATPSPSQALSILNLISKALALDSENGPAIRTLNQLQQMTSYITFTPPPTIPWTATPLVSETPTVNPSDTNTPQPSRTPQVVEVTVVQTRIVTATPANTTAPSPTLRPSSTPTLMTVPAADAGTASNWFVWPLLVLVGFVGGVLVMRRPKA